MPGWGVSVSVSVSVSLAICICHWICFCIHIRRYNCLSLCLSVCCVCVVCISFECCLMTTWTRRDDAACFLSSPSMATLEVVVALFSSMLLLSLLWQRNSCWNIFWLETGFLGLFIKARIYYSGVGGHKYFVYNYLIYADFLPALTVCI